MSELFDIEPSLSPRLKWMRENGFQVTKIIDCGTDPVTVTFMASKLVPVSATEYDENEAIVALAKKLNLKLWNE